MAIEAMEETQTALVESQHLSRCFFLKKDFFVFLSIARELLDWPNEPFLVLSALKSRGQFFTILKCLLGYMRIQNSTLAVAKNQMSDHT